MSIERWFVAVSLLGGTWIVGSGCGSGESAPAAPPEAPAAAAAPAPAEAAPGAPAAPAPAPAAPSGPPTLEQLIATTQPIVPAPAPQSDGPLSLTAEICRLDGPPIIGDDSFRSIGQIAQASDGSLYLLDQDKRLRRYTVAPGDGCVLTMDTTLGENGRLSLGEGLGSAPESVVADAQGHVFVASSMGGTSRITGTHVDYHCDTRGDLSVSPSGTDGFAVWGSGSPRRITFTDSGCTAEDWAPEGGPTRIESISFLDATHVLVGGTTQSSDPHLVRVHRLDGHGDGAAFGDTTDSMSARDHFCYAHEAHAISEGRIAVLDGNCRKLRVFDRAHAVVAAIDLSRLVGVNYPWFPSMTEARDGVAFITVNQQRGDSHPRPEVYDTFVARIRGL